MREKEKIVDIVGVHGRLPCLEVSKARAAISFQFNPQLSKRKQPPYPCKALLVKLSLHWASDKSTERHGNTRGEGKRGFINHAI